MVSQDGKETMHVTLGDYPHTEEIVNTDLEGICKVSQNE
mgnify:CR=1 FL=1